MKLAWDPEIDTPATVAVIGGGPVGVEAALYARFLGYFVMLFDARRVGSRLVRWGEIPMQVPFGEATSSLGLAALEAQDVHHALPDADSIVPYRDFVEKYLTPVAKSDLLEECIHINSPVVSVSRAHFRKNHPPAIEDRAEDEFRLLMNGKVRGEFTQLADIVLDCSGDGRTPAGIGPGGGMAIGQPALCAHFEVGPRDVHDRDRDRFVGKHTVLFGAGPVACRNAVQFVALANENPGTKLTWVIPKGTKHEEWLKSVALLNSDLAIEASRLLTGNCTGVIHVDAWGAESLSRDANGCWQIKLLVGEEDTADLEADVVLVTELSEAWNFTDGLGLELCPHRKLTTAANQWLMGQAAGELEISLESAITSEPHYYVLGRKSVGGDPRFTFAHARQQIQQVFGLIGGRADLDVYQTVLRQRAT
jgi:hypothetical protein